MGVKCDILFQKVKGDVFRPGQSVVGVVEYVIDKPAKFESIDLYFVGKGKCVWSESDSGDTIYCRNEEVYVSVHEDLLTTTYDETIEPGTYKHPFKFLLPENIPSSIKTKQCTIKYKITVAIVKANCFRTTKKFDIEIPVYGYVNPVSPEPVIFKLKEEPCSKTGNNKSNVIIEMEKKIVAPGEDIKLNVTIKNDPKLPVKYLKSKLMKHLTFVSVTGRNFVITGPVKNTRGCSPELKTNSESKFTCVVPTNSKSCSIQHSKVLIGEYKVRVTLKYPFPHPKASMDIPVIIGETKSPSVVDGKVEEMPTCSVMVQKETERDPTVVEDGQDETSSCSEISEKEKRRDSYIVNGQLGDMPSCSHMPVYQVTRNVEIPSSSNVTTNEEGRGLPVVGNQQNENPSYSVMPEKEETIDPLGVENKQDETPSSSKMQENGARSNPPVDEDQIHEKPSSSVKLEKDRQDEEPTCSKSHEKEYNSLNRRGTIVIKLT